MRTPIRRVVLAGVAYASIAASPITLSACSSPPSHDNPEHHASSAQSSEADTDGIDSALTGANTYTPVVRPQPTLALSTEQSERIAEEYRSLVRTNVDTLLKSTQRFVAAYRSGDNATARSLYPAAHADYERIQPTAEALEPAVEAIANMDRLLNRREKDFQPIDAQDEREWHGWHAIERDLWPAPNQASLSAEERTIQADALLDGTQQFHNLVMANEFTVSVTSITTDANSLLEEAILTKVNGDENAYAHTDLWDLAACIDGAKDNYQLLSAVVREKDPRLDTSITDAFDALTGELDSLKQGSRYPLYPELSDETTRALTHRVNALRAHLTTVSHTLARPDSEPAPSNDRTKEH